MNQAEHGMKLFLAKFRVEFFRYPAGPLLKRDTDFRLIYAESEDQAQEKLERAVLPETYHGDDSYTLKDLEITEAIV